MIAHVLIIFLLFSYSIRLRWQFQVQSAEIDSRMPKYWLIDNDSPMLKLPGMKHCVLMIFQGNFANIRLFSSLLFPNPYIVVQLYI